jgi:hypothetical protein
MSVMTKAKCRELFDVMKKAMIEFEDALRALRSIHPTVSTGFDFYDTMNGDLYLMEAGEALEQTEED